MIVPRAEFFCHENTLRPSCKLLMWYPINVVDSISQCCYECCLRENWPIFNIKHTLN